MTIQSHRRTALQEHGHDQLQDHLISRGDAEDAEKNVRDIDEITGEIVDAAYHLHVGLGPGLLESVYEVVLAGELSRRGLRVERQKVMAFDFDGLHFDEGFRVDLFVEGVVVVELKSLEKLAPVHTKQVLTYLRLLDARVGLLINFGAPTLQEGLRRIVNKYTASSASPRLRVNHGTMPSPSD